MKILHINQSDVVGGAAIAIKAYLVMQKKSWGRISSQITSKALCASKLKKIAHQTLN